MFTITSIIEGGKYQYIKEEYETIQEARDYMKLRKNNFGIKNFELVNRNKKGFSHYINKNGFEIFTNPNFILHNSPDDWELLWITGPSINGFSEVKATGLLHVSDLKELKVLNLKKLAFDGQLKSFYYFNWRDQYFTDELSKVDECGEPLPKEVMDSVKEDTNYLSLNIERYFRDNHIITLYLLKDIISNCVISLAEVSQLYGVRFILKYKGKILYGSGSHGFDILEAIQLLRQYSFQVEKNTLQKLSEAIKRDEIKDMAEYEDIIRKIDIFKKEVH